MNAGDIPVPTTLEECMVALTQLLSPAEQLKVLKMSRDDLWITHWGVGQWIRNNWGLWKGGPLQDHMKALGFTHGDDMSGTIIKEFWLRMNKLPSELEQDIQEYKKFWAKSAAEHAKHKEDK